MSELHPHHRAKLHLQNVREIFRLIGEIRAMSAEPDEWRQHMTKRIGQIMHAEIVVSSEVHFRAIGKGGEYQVHDIGWGCDSDGNNWKIDIERAQTPEAYWLDVLGKSHEEFEFDDNRDAERDGERDDDLVAVKPARAVYGGTSFILSQYPLPHLGTVDQLGLHRAWVDKTFSREQHRLVRMFHVELGRLWKHDAIEHAKDPRYDLPPRLSQTLAELAAGHSEKEVSARLGISRHTVHNYVKALHRRLGVSSRGELLAKAHHNGGEFTPKLSVQTP